MSRGAFDSIVATIVGGAFLVLVLIATIGTAQRMRDDSQLLAAGTNQQVLAEQSVTATPAPTASVSVTASPAPTATATTAPTETPEPTATHTPRPTETFTATPAPTNTTLATSVVIEGSVPTPPPTPAASLHFWLSRPISPNGVDYVARFYPYASTGEGQYEVHHGVEFVNPEGTPILATAPGSIIYAGTDKDVVVGPNVNYYGNVVVQQLERRWHEQPVYVVYGHLSSITVSTGDPVETGDQIGLVGETGIALGPHLHMEVRLGKNSYANTRNPQLWLTPKEGQGILVGRILDLQGNPVHEALVSLEDPQTDEMKLYEYTYADGTVNADDEWDENLLVGDVPAGQYRVSANINGQTRAAFVTIRSGEVSYVRLQERPRPTATATPLVTATPVPVPATHTPVPEEPAPTETPQSTESQQEQQ